MQASPVPETFAPLPLRARGALEILDVAIKVYRRYLWVLLGWSALVMVCSFIPVVNYVAFLLTPLIIGATMCCIAAAVRGQPVRFAQCWNFTKGRFGPMIGMYLLSLVVAFGALFLLFLGCGLLAFVGVQLFSGASGGLQLAAGIVGGILLLTLVTLFSAVAMIWQNMVPIVVCMEDDKHNTRALARAYELMRGQWVRATTLIAVLMLGFMALMGILIVTGVLLVGVDTLRNLANGQTPDSSILAAIFGLGLLAVILWTLWNPIFYLILGLFYLDIRVRKEALDLEWTAHVTAPAQSPVEAAHTVTADSAFSSIAPAAPTPIAPSPVAASPFSSAAPSGAMPDETMRATPAATPAVMDEAMPQVEQATPQTGATSAGFAAGAMICPQCGAAASAPPPGSGAAGAPTLCMQCGARLTPVDLAR